MKIGKKLKKNNVACDVVAFGDDEPGNGAKLEVGQPARRTRRLRGSPTYPRYSPPHGISAEA